MTDWPGQSLVDIRPRAASGPVVVGLVSNVPDRALQTTERQFLGLLRAACPGIEIQLRLFTCPGIARAIKPRGAAGQAYSDIAALPDTALDALIVTGMEPEARSLQDEPIYAALAQIADWAEHHAVPVIWSCLAAHAIVLHLDGIARIRLPEKLVGVFRCNAVGHQQKLLNGLPSRWASPHSRYHGLPEARLIDSGYEMLSRSDEIGADMFIRQRAASFLFLQGHPEYGPETLLQQYRRDVGRHLAGEQELYPPVPANVCDTHMAAELARIRNERLGDLGSLDALIDGTRTSPEPCPWRHPTARLIGNWLNGMEGDDVQAGNLPVAANIGWGVR